MEPWNVRDERPMRPAERSYAMPVLIGALLLAAVGAVYYVFSQMAPPPAPPAPAPQAAPAAPEAAPAPQAEAAPALRHPAPQAQAPEKPLPALEQSDTMMRHTLVELLGNKAFAELVIPSELVRRIVATVDNLPRGIAPRRKVPLNAAPGRFAVTGSGEAVTLDPRNHARYTPYVQALEAVDARTLVRAYAAAYPLFQRAYAELGYPDRHFNDRLVEAIDDLLGAPEIEGPIALLRPRVLYEFADPDLETRSAGQKILIRMGSANAVRVKAKLREIRRELLAAAQKP